eukprot:1878297-Alexandrium_andersonii.AAC.1
MSASLVGSEMCIRDRSLRGTPAKSSRFPALTRQKTGELRRCCLLGQGPVSYTHLTLPTICSV